jgi:hypothetical protein
MIISPLNLPVLFARMEWPSLLVRERAASQIVALLKNPETCQVTGLALVEWLANRRLESLAANVLLIPLRIKADGVEVTPGIDAYKGAISCPSVLSHVLFNEIRDHRPMPMAGGIGIPVVHQNQSISIHTSSGTRRVLSRRFMICGLSSLSEIS